MRLIFCTEARFIKTPDGKIYSLESSFSYSLFRRYLQHFDRVIIFARLKIGTESEIIESNQVNGEGIEVFGLPYYIGFNQFMLRYLSLRWSIAKGLDRFAEHGTSIVCRVPGRIGAEVVRNLRRRRKAYAIEVVGDPYDVLSKGATRHPLRVLIRWFSTRSLKHIAWNAPLALYVTKTKLQERYPCKNLVIGASDAVMTDDCYLIGSKPVSSVSEVKLICVGSLEQMHKAPDIMLAAMNILVRRGFRVRLVWIGDGKHRDEMINLAARLGLTEFVSFIGKIPAGEAVRSFLDSADIFVMPSRMEGLPRAMVEAMARGLPCIGTRICGIQELLPDSCLVSVNDSSELANKIGLMICKIDWRVELSTMNLRKAFEYHESLLGRERNRFFSELKQLG